MTSIVNDPLWKHPIYSEIYQSLPLDNLLQNPLSEEMVKTQIAEGMAEKKSGHLCAARRMFLKLVCSNALLPSVWIDFARLEMECGEYALARAILNLADSIHPHHEILLQRRIKVEEKLNNIRGLVYVVEEMKQLDSQKALKIHTEAIVAIARLGYSRLAYDYFQPLLQNKFFTGNFYLDYLAYELYASSLASCVALIPSALQRYPRFGPLWFVCLDLIEHHHQVQWDRQSIVSRVNCPMLLETMLVAQTSLTQDIMWRVYVSRIQFWMRAIADLRLLLFHV